MHHNNPEIYKKRMHKIILLLLLSFIVSSAIQPVHAGDTKNVLYINSYHKGLDWSDDESRGVSDCISQNGNVNLYTEYMDTKNYPSEENYKNLYNYYMYKYRNKNFDVIITSDDNALNFVTVNRETLFNNNTPVVFCGVNEVAPDFTKRYPDITGCLETLPIKENINNAIAINPVKLKCIYFITDDTETGQSYRNVIKNITKDYDGSVEFVNIYDIPMSELLYEVSNMPDDSAIIYTVFNRDANGEVFTNKEAVKAIAGASSVPVYVMVDNLVGTGSVGGIVSSPYVHGYFAAEKAIKIINGIKPSKIPITHYNVSQPLFDYDILKNFGYDLSKLPENSTVINKPPNFISISVAEFTIIIFACIGLFVILVVLVFLNRKLKITGELLKLSEERLSMALYATQDGLWDWDFDKKEYYTNSAGLKMLGYRTGEIVITPNTWIKMIHPDDRKAFIEGYKNCIKSGGKFIQDYRIMTKDKGWKWIRSRGNVEKDSENSPERIVGTFTDIDETVMYRNALLEANKKLSILSSVTRHDILNQVTALLGYIEIMNDDIGENPKVSKYIPKLVRPAEVIQQQINFTKDYEEMGLSKPVWQNVATAAKRAAASAKDENTVISIETGNVEIFADKMLEKVFFNLFDNTKRHGKSATKISVSFKTGNDKSGIITVEDNGIGIEEDKKEEIFEKGFGGNSGYGLFLVKDILEITGIKIRETGIHGKCARFEMTVPDNLWHVPADIRDIK